LITTQADVINADLVAFIKSQSGEDLLAFLKT